ncbi:MAG: DNA/RNA non-specific endonuclease, partial [bacterium]|nr:DNA/RNA non-specific endonuclease [bacterium]
MSPQHTTVTRWFTTAVLFVTLVASGFAIIGAPSQMQLGNPSGATSDTNNHGHYLIQRDQYAVDYNDTTHEPNWVSWDLTAADSGSAGRSSVFFQDTTLPAGFYQVLTTDYSGSGYDRGHMCPSADRTATRADNDVTFFMSNMVPQTPDNNQGVWASFETYSRTLAAAGNELLITSGTSGFAGSTIASGVAIPGYTWKIVVVVPVGTGTAVDRIIAAGASAIRVIAIKIPNIAGVRSTPWETFVTSAAQIQSDTGYTFFTALPAPIAAAFRTVVDGSSAAGSPSITSPPTSQTTVVGGTATFTVTATGNAPLSYQWFHDDVEIPGATSDILPLNSVQAADVGSYYVVVTNDVGSTTSAAATLTVTGLPPVVTASPASQTVNAGANVTFAVTVTGSPTLAYQWRKTGAPISGA